MNNNPFIALKSFTLPPLGTRPAITLMPFCAFCALLFQRFGCLSRVAILKVKKKTKNQTLKLVNLDERRELMEIMVKILHANHMLIAQ